MSSVKKVNLRSYVVQRDHLLTTDLDDETVMMSLERAAYYGLDNTARRIWSLIDTPRLVADLCQSLLTEYSVEPETCERQVCAFLEELQREDLIQVVDAPTRAGASA